jgi:hypothetical protein
MLTVIGSEGLEPKFRRLSRFAGPDLKSLETGVALWRGKKVRTVGRRVGRDG